jgi:hypothetical protein
MSRKISVTADNWNLQPFQAMVSIIPRQYKDGSFMVAMLLAGAMCQFVF